MHFKVCWMAIATCQGTSQSLLRSTYYAGKSKIFITVDSTRISHSEGVKFHLNQAFCEASLMSSFTVCGACSWPRGPCEDDGWAITEICQISFFNTMQPRFLDDAGIWGCQWKSTMNRDGQSRRPRGSSLRTRLSLNLAAQLALSQLSLPFSPVWAIRLLLEGLQSRQPKSEHNVCFLTVSSLTVL